MIRKEMFYQVEIEALERPDYCFGLNNIHFPACATISNNMEQYALACMCIAHSQCATWKHISAKQVIHNRCTALR